jgi:hypothetical protein
LAKKVSDQSAATRDEEERDRVDKTPEGWQKLWNKEFEAADRELKNWRKQASEVEKVYLDDRKDTDVEHEKKTNMYTADVLDLESQLYGRTPQTDVTRKYQDANDQVGRAAALMMQRLLNGDIERPDDRFARSAGHALSDHLRANFGLIRWRYEWEPEQVEATKAIHRPHPETGEMVEAVPATDAYEKVKWEDVVAEYCHWRDVKWSPCRVWEEARWIAFRVPMTRRELVKRFGAKGKKVGLDSRMVDKDDGDSTEDQPRYPWHRADVWECWSKEHARVFWVVVGEKRILDEADDPLGLADFWPCPRPMVDWITTTKFVPKPAYMIAQDSYRAVEKLTTRIDLLVSSLRVLGVFDENFAELQGLLESTDENTMIPVANWQSAVADKGGMDGVVSWFPLDQVVAALEQLVLQREKEIELNWQVTGRADVQRGHLQNPGETATATRAKMRSSSKRVQRKQDMFAEFVSDAQRIRAEIIALKFSDETIKARSNIEMTEDAPLADQAIQLIRQEGVDGCRITVKSESLSLPDFAEMQENGTEFVTAVSTVVGALVKLPPVALPILPEMANVLKWYASRFRGAVEIEAAMDRMAKKLEEIAKNPPQQQGEQPDMSKVEAQKLKNEGDQAAHPDAEAQRASRRRSRRSPRPSSEEIELQAQHDTQPGAGAPAAGGQPRACRARARAAEASAVHRRPRRSGIDQPLPRTGASCAGRPRARARQLEAESKPSSQDRRPSSSEQKGKQAVKAASVKAKAQKKPGGK